MLLGIVISWTLGAVPPELAAAEAAMSKYKYADATVLLKKARAAKKLDRPSLLKILEMQGIAAGQQRLSAEAVSAFTELLTLDPTRKLAGDFAPRVTTPFLEASALVSEGGALEVKEAAPEIKDRRVVGLRVEVRKDPLKRVVSVVFHVGGKTMVGTANRNTWTVPVEGPEVSWWAEVFGENGAQLVLVGSEASPLTAAPPAPLVSATPPPEPRVEPPAPGTPPSSGSALSTPGPASSSSGMRTVAYVAGGAAIAAGVAGAIFGARSSSTFRSLEGLRSMTDSSGNITGITQKEATTRGAQAAMDGLIANTLFIAAGAMAAAGVVLFLLGSPADVITFSMSPNALFVQVAFP